jgi:hypothetical protein
LLAPIQEFDKTRKDNTSGMLIVGIVFVVFLIRVWYNLKRRLKSTAAIKK